MYGIVPVRRQRHQGAEEINICKMNLTRNGQVYELN